MGKVSGMTGSFPSAPQGDDGGLRRNASADQYDPVSGGYRSTSPEEAQKFGGAPAPASGQMNPFLKLLKGGLGGLSNGLNAQQSQQSQLNQPNRNFYGY